MFSFFRRKSAQLDCNAVAELVQSYLDNQTDPELTKQISAHLDDCLRCGIETETYASIKQSLGKKRTAVPVESLERLKNFGQNLVDEGPPAEPST